MASGRNDDMVKGSTPEASELASDALSALAHELGGIASALDLRAAAMSKTIPEQDLAALRELVEQVRIATRTVRFVRGTEGAGSLNPGRLQTLADWWKFTDRFTSVVLPRGVQVDARLHDAHLNGVQASGLSWVWLAACKELSERGIAAPCTITLRAGPAGNGSRKVLLAAEVDAGRFTPGNGVPSRWARFAAKVARDSGISPTSWEQDASVMRWQCTIDG